MYTRYTRFTSQSTTWTYLRLFGSGMNFLGATIVVMSDVFPQTEYVRENSVVFIGVTATNCRMNEFV